MSRTARGPQGFLVLGLCIGLVLSLFYVDESSFYVGALSVNFNALVFCGATGLFVGLVVDLLVRDPWERKVAFEFFGVVLLIALLMLIFLPETQRIRE